MEKYFENYKKDTWYQMPNDVVGVAVNPITGDIDNGKKKIFYYLKGTEPTFGQNDLETAFKEENKKKSLQ